MNDPYGINVQLIVGIVFTVLHFRNDLNCCHISVIFIGCNCKCLCLTCTESIRGHLLICQHIRAAAVIELQTEEELILTAAVSVRIRSLTITCHIDFNCIGIAAVRKSQIILGFLIGQCILFIAPVKLINLRDSLGRESEFFALPFFYQHLHTHSTVSLDTFILSGIYNIRFGITGTRLLESTDSW